MAVRKYSTSWTLRKSWRPIETPLGTFIAQPMEELSIQGAEVMDPLK